MNDFSNASFPPDTLDIMKNARDAAVASLPDPVSSAHVQSIAETILRTAKEGKRDPRRLDAYYFIVWVVSPFAAALLLSPPVAAELGQFIVSPVAAKKLNGLPPGPLYWRIENFPTLDLAQSAAGASPTSLAAEVSGKVWLFTLGPKGGTTPGGTKVAEVGLVPVLAAPEYLLRINHAGGPPGSKTPVHSHPGSESFYVLAGQVGQRTPKHQSERPSASRQVPATTH
jgi:hypothetical protein